MHSQAALIRALESAVNPRIRSPRAAAAFIVSQKAFYRRLARAASLLDGSGKATTAAPVRQADIPPYAGSHPAVLRMMEWLAPLRDDLVHAVVHGSLATGEEIPYSDFDGIVILKDETVGDAGRLAAVAQRLSRSRRIMLDLDPLQHHGWYVLNESSLARFDESRFPSILFERCRSLVPALPARITWCSAGPPADGQAFQAYCRNLSTLLTKPHPARNLYSLKSILSRFMLLPSLFHGAKHRAAIHKKESFDVVRDAVPQGRWEVMDAVSDLRLAWPEATAMPYRRQLASLYFLHHRLLAPFYPAIPAAMDQRLRGGLYAEMAIFAETLAREIPES